MTNPYAAAQTQMQTQMTAQTSPSASASKALPSTAFSGVSVDPDTLRSFATDLKKHAEDLLQEAQKYYDLVATSYPKEMRKNTADGGFPPEIANFMQRYSITGPDALNQMINVANSLSQDADSMIEYANSAESSDSEAAKNIQNT